MRADATLLLRLVRMIYAYATEGRRIRNLYRTATDPGQTLWVDDLPDGEHRL
jgi:hypothetical protein